MARTRKHDNHLEQVRDALFAMEPEIHNLDSLVVALHIFSEAQDSIEPAALSMLANAGRASINEIKEALQNGLKTVAQ